ncbi:RNA polymerase I specific transcription initiation factor RRN3 protein [Raphanus sativus]|uniref:RNA polymerase I-specific transcription initiation factor rrn3 n=1 Tax=Raphanus sativus TaxID=3726 RepID=A0A6J0MMH5_RAPSA|nr:RNA polymerase I-specific transcription initiation factor rrn3 [Raphanus sativus]XP_018472696.1 PREDICTED: RNA polymerase I-specific transcription initiation factor rrn3-like [Raphanus sativus]KAJ4907081.1 RNA polymerase I specific transcription initiation factor RRN3 protein [Raphanus sativus]
MGAAEVFTDPSSLYDVGNNDLSDTETVQGVRNALASVLNGESDRFDQLVETIQINDRSDHAAVAQLNTLLKALSGSVACIDITHHQKLLSAIFGMSLWNQRPLIMDALVGLLISLAATSGKYLDSCLHMLVRHFVPPPWVINRLSQSRVSTQKGEVLSRVHEALLKISLLVPLAPSRLFPMLSQQMPKMNKKDQDQVVVTYVENLLKLESSSIGQVGGNMIFMMVMERLRDLDLEIDWDDILQDDSSRGMFDMELEDAMNEGDELPAGSLNQDTSSGKIAFESLDKLMVTSFDHLEACQDAGRLDQVFEKLFESFENFILNTYKSKVSQFLMFYACSLDPENCGVKFGSKLLDIFLSSNKPRPTRMSAVAYLASYLARAKFLPVSYVASMLKRLVDECADYCRICNDDIRPEAHQLFYSGCQAIMYVLCFRMRSILDVPRFRSELIPLESILMHKLNPLMVCLPSVVAEFLKQAKAVGLFVVSDSFIFDDLLESELSRAFGGRERLDTFFPFDPYLLKSSNSVISPNFIYWSTVMNQDDDDEDDAEIIVNGDEESDDEEEEEGDLDYAMDKMSITPKHSFKNKMERDRLMKMPSMIRPSTSPRSL